MVLQTLLNQVQTPLLLFFKEMLHQLLSIKSPLIRHAMPEFSKDGSNLVSITIVLWDVVFRLSMTPEIRSIICNESGFRDLVHMLKDQFQKENDKPSKVKSPLTSRTYEHNTIEF